MKVFLYYSNIVSVLLDALPQSYPSSILSCSLSVVVA